VEAFESIRLSIWATADAAPKASTDASATVATFMLITTPWPSTNGEIPRFQKAARLSARIQPTEAVRFGLQEPDPAFPNMDVRDVFRLTLLVNPIGGPVSIPRFNSDEAQGHNSDQRSKELRDRQLFRSHS